MGAGLGAATINGIMSLESPADPIDETTLPRVRNVNASGCQ